MCGFLCVFPSDLSREKITRFIDYQNSPSCVYALCAACTILRRRRPPGVFSAAGAAMERGKKAGERTAFKKRARVDLLTVFCRLACDPNWASSFRLPRKPPDSKGFMVISSRAACPSVALSPRGLENTIQFIKAKQWTHYFKKVREWERERGRSDTPNWLLMEKAQPRGQLRFNDILPGKIRGCHSPKSQR